jgi:hypothetical protein
MSNTSKIQEKSIERRGGPATGRQLMISGGSLIELDPEELRAVVGGKKPVVEITIKPDGTIVIVQK